jgi:hypothetical protein
MCRLFRKLKFTSLGDKVPNCKCVILCMEAILFQPIKKWTAMRIFIQKKLHVNLLCALLLLFMQKTNAQTTETVGVPFKGSTGITVSAADIEARSRIEDAKREREQMLRQPNKDTTKANENVNTMHLLQTPMNGTNSTRSTNASQTIHSNFTGIGLRETNTGTYYLNPDGSGDVGTTQVCVLSNRRLKFFARNTVCQPAQTTPLTNSDSILPASFNVDIQVFFSPVADSTQFNVLYPHVRFDRLTRRWFIMAVTNRNQSNRIVIAVSNGATVSGSSSSSFTFFYFVPTQLTPLPANYVNGVLTQTSLGVDKNALYIGGNVYNSYSNSAFQGNSLVVVRKNSILGIGPVVATAFHNVNVMYRPLGVHNTDPNATDGYFISPDIYYTASFPFYRVSTPGLTPTLSTILRINVPNYFISGKQPYKGSSFKYLTTLSDVMFDATLVKDKIAGTSSIWTSHAISVDSAGAPYPDTARIKRRNASRFYEFRNLSGTPSIYQIGTLFDTARLNPRGFWIPTITGTGQGHAVIGCSTAGSTNYPDVAVTGRYRTDALGTLQPFQLATASAGYISFTNDEQEFWGQYSQTVIDPLDDMTVWTFQEYCNNTLTYGIRAVQLKAPPPATPNPIGTVGCGFVVNGTSRYVQVTINGTSINNAGFFDPGPDIGGPGYNRLTVTSTGSGLIVGDINFISPTKILLEMIFPPSLAGSTQTLTITNPDCQSVTTTYTLPTACNGNVYTFNGSGNWNDANNWMFGNIPPTTLTSPDEIVIDPVAGGECVLDIPTQTIATGAKVTVVGTKKFRIVGYLINQ